ncbi:MAG: hypothetical protein HY067_10445 [Betaproteobacteria bacterium]|nr:hypothetical protein [Betaproteobacteria bacterium]
MCGRYVRPEEAGIERFWDIGRHNKHPFARRFNVSPTSIIPIPCLDRSTGEIIKAKQPHFRFRLQPFLFQLDPTSRLLFSGQGPLCK